MQTVTQHRSAGRTLERPAPQDGRPRMDPLRRAGLHGRPEPRHETLTAEESGVGDSGRAAQIIKDAIPTAIDESVLIQSKTLKAQDPSTEPCSRRDPAPRGRRRASPRSPVRTARASRRRPISDDGHSDARQLRDQGRHEGRGGDEGRGPHRRRDRGRPEGARDFNIEQFGEGSSEEAFMDIFRADLQKATTASLPITLILLVRVRDAGGGGHPAPPGDHRRDGHDGHRRGAQPPVTRRGIHQPRDPAHRPGRGRGLRAVLPPPGARGALRRA